VGATTDTTKSDTMTCQEGGLFELMLIVSTKLV
jgi:hypothetical protein